MKGKMNYGDMMKGLGMPMKDKEMQKGMPKDKKGKKKGK